MKKGLALTERERRFVEAFLGPCAGNASASARAAGFKARSAHVAASRLLKKDKVQKLLKARIEKREQLTDLTNEAIDKRLMEIAQDRTLDTRDQLSALRELNKIRGRHSVQVNLQGRLTLEEALTRVHEKVRERQAARLNTTSTPVKLESGPRRLLTK